MAESSYDFLVKKLDEFIRKYYVNQIIKGVILFLSLAFILFLLVVISEYVGNFSSVVRKVLFYSFSSALLLIFAFLILKPLLKVAAIGKRISHEKASEIIGHHFSDVNDKLLNVLQLKSQSGHVSADLVIASINQKINDLNPVPFTMAVNFKENSRYLKYLIIPAVVIIVLAAFEPKIIKEGTNRLVEHDTEFIPTAPYSIEIENKGLKAFKNEDFKLKVTLSGEELPNKLNIIYNGQRFLMKKESNNRFEYTFNNLQENIKFTLFDGEFESKKYELTSLPKPILQNFSTQLFYPKYLNRTNNTVENTGDLIIPEGTMVRWVFNTKETDDLLFIGTDSTFSLVMSAEDEFSYSKRIYKNDRYGLSMSNRFVQAKDTVFYNIDVIPDLRPSIELDTKRDSLNPKMIYFKGFVKDDYGFSRLVFHSKFIGANDSVGEANMENIPINRNLTQTDFYHVWNTGAFGLRAGDQLEYYFEVWDNDGINGSKSARTQKLTFKAPTKDELNDKNKENSKLVKKELEESIVLTYEIKKELEALNEKLLNKKEIGFQEKKQLESLLNKQKKVQKSLDKLKEKNKQNNKLREEFSPQDEALLEKQKQLEELFEKVMTEEMKEMMKEIEEMMEKLKKDDLQKALEKMEMNNEELEKELDRNLELFKQLEVEKQLAEAIEKLDELKKEQKQLKEESQDKKSDAEEQKAKQDELNKEFEKLSEKLDELEKSNEELESPNPMEKTDALEEQIKEDMKESSEELSKQNKKKASESQESSQEKMEELSEKLNQSQQNMSSSQNAENLEDMRSLLENLIQLSFDQEDVMERLRKTDINDPMYVSLAQEQMKLKDDSKVVEDSLFALSKRVPQLSGDINREMTAVTFNMEKSIDELGERRTSLANNRQQLSMTSLNNLALMLDAAVQNMQMQMQMAEGKGQCKKPGSSGKPKPGAGMKKMQQQLNQQMEQLKKAMEQGKNPGGKKKGEKPGQGKPGGQGGMSKELAQMAAKQGAIREAVKKLQDEIGEKPGGKGGAGNLKKLEELMEKTETDLVNKQITNETLMRQQEIMTRLLESEKAEREREKDEKRESTEFTDELFRNPNQFFEYNKRKDQEIELLKTLPPSFNNYYKSKVSEYFNQIEQ